MVLNDTDPSQCSTNDIPSAKEYFEASGTYGIALVSMGAIALALSILIFLDTLQYVFSNCSSRLKTSTVYVTAIYPISCLVSYLALLVPRSHLLAEALCQAVLMSAMYQLFCMFIAYCGGDSQLVKKVKASRLSLKVGPCCCWPCCLILPTYKVNKKTIGCLKLLLLQLPLIQGLLYFIQLVLWAEDNNLYQTTYMYLQPVIIVSVLSGIWGMLMTIELLKETVAPEFLLMKKFWVLQLVIVITKVQGFITKSLVWFDALPCIPPLTAQVYANTLHNLLMMVEMVLLGFLARRLYKRELCDVDLRHRGSTISTVFGNASGKIVDNNADGITNLAYNL